MMKMIATTRTMMMNDYVVIDGDDDGAADGFGNDNYDYGR